MPSIAELMLGELDREAVGTRRTLEWVPEGKGDWKPHEKSMPLGYLAALVATMPSWIAAMINRDSLDLAEPSKYQPRSIVTRGELLEVFESALAEAKAALAATNDSHLMTKWQLKIGGQVVYEAPRHVAIRDSAINHLAHHRGQLTVYLRLNDQPVPAIYGPSADERI